MKVSILTDTGHRESTVNTILWERPLVMKKYKHISELLSHSYDCNISGTPVENFITSGTNRHFKS